MNYSILTVGKIAALRAGRRLVAVSAAVVGSMSWAAVPVPTVTGPIPADVPGSPGHNYPFFATDVVLKNYGYVEEEFYFDGKANTYDTVVFSNNITASPTANVVTTGNPYRSRMLVRRPADPSKFNGTVVVEWTNVTNGYDSHVWWWKPKSFYLREGYAYVEVSVQNNGISASPNGLKAWSPTRYGSLNVNGGGTLTGDALAFDIFSQAAAAVRSVPIVMGGLPVQTVIGVGESQSGITIARYANAVHVRDPIYDGLIPSEGGQRIRDDLITPVIKVMTESEFSQNNNQVNALQPDTARFRSWTVAGGSHAEQSSLLARAAVHKRDINALAQDTCATPARSRVEMRYIYSAAVSAMNKWILQGTPPPYADRLTLIDPARFGVARDVRGNALGGIRTAEIDVPVAKEAGDTCADSGTHVPFTTDVLKSLYATHDDYVQKYTAAAMDSVNKGFVLLADAQEGIQRAKAHIWGSGLECGPLCADLRQFPLNPSSSLLRNQTAYMQIKGADASLVPLLDRVTWLIAQGYTAGADTPTANANFTEAGRYLDQYVVAMQQVLARGNIKPETATLMTQQANVLKTLVLGLVH